MDDSKTPKPCNGAVSGDNFYSHRFDGKEEKWIFKKTAPSVEGQDFGMDGTVSAMPGPAHVCGPLLRERRRDIKSSWRAQSSRRPASDAESLKNRFVCSGKKRTLLTAHHGG